MKKNPIFEKRNGVYFVIIFLLFIISYDLKGGEKNTTISEKYDSLNISRSLINVKGMTIAERFIPPQGYERRDLKKFSFGNYLRYLTLKPHGADVLYFDRSVKKNDNIYIAVIELPIGNQDLLQCADAIMLLKGEYLFHQKLYDKIHFNLVKDNKPHYYKDWGGKINSYKNFRKYMDHIFAYANTLSLYRELVRRDYDDMSIGDVFIQTGRPYGHAVIIADMATHKITGKNIFLLAQSYMPAQEIQILINPNDSTISPWYSSDLNGPLETPEWIFQKLDLRRFRE